MFQLQGIGSNGDCHRALSAERHAASRAWKSILSEIAVDIMVEALLIHGGAAARHGFGHEFHVRGVHFLVSTEDARISVCGKIFHGGTVVRATPRFFGDVAVILSSEPLVDTG